MADITDYLDVPTFESEGSLEDYLDQQDLSGSFDIPDYV